MTCPKRNHRLLECTVKEWIEYTFEGANQLANSTISCYAYGQRDSKAALRWIVANADTYGISNEIAVGGYQRDP